MYLNKNNNKKFIFFYVILAYFMLQNELFFLTCIVMGKRGSHNELFA